MKKIAYLIVAHTDAHILKRLITALNSNADFYIHLDKKVDKTQFEMEFVRFKNVFFISDNHWVHWAGFGVVAAQLSLIEDALKRSKDYMRLVHLSGLDYPLVSNHELYMSFSSKEVEYISGYNITQSNQLGQKNRVRLYHLFKNGKGNFNKIRKILGYLTLKLSSILSIKKVDKVLIYNKPSDIYFGSQFFAVTTNFANYLMNVVRENPNLVKYFKSSFAPDELFIQTIFFNSIFSTKAYNVLRSEECDLHKLAPLHYFEYTSSIKVFSEIDYDTVTNSNKFFIRKVTSEKSLKLIEKIDLIRSNV